MPQGGIDAGENPRDAVMRELWEETGAINADYLGETDWLTYEFPPFAGPPSHRLAKFRGQRQKWFALRFTGRDDEIDPLTPRNGQPAEFDQWRWERLDRVADLVVPFRREVYRTVARRFAEFDVNGCTDWRQWPRSLTALSSPDASSAALDARSARVGARHGGGAR